MSRAQKPFPFPPVTFMQCFILAKCKCFHCNQNWLGWCAIEGYHFQTFASHYVAARFMAGNLSGCPLGTLLTPLWRARRATVHSNHFYLPKCHNLGFDSQGRYKKKSCVGSKEGSCLVNTHIFTVVQQAETPMVTSRLHSCPIVFQIRTLSPLVIISQGCLTKYDTISSP